MFKFYMTIGDWCGDGHKKSDDFLIESNLPIESIREAHFQIEKATGINIEDICSCYEEDEINPKIMQELKKLGFHFDNSTGMGDEVINSEEMARLWVFLLMKANPELKLEFVEETIPSLHFNGYDSQNRHIGSVGYGLFRA